VTEPRDGYTRLAEAVTDVEAGFRDTLTSWGAPPRVAKKLAKEMAASTEPAYPTGTRNGLRTSPIGAKRRAEYITEANFQAMVEELAVTCGWTTFHVTQPRRSPAGFPDLVMFRERVVFAELKSRSPQTGKAGRLSPWQIEYAHTIQTAGAEYYAWLFPDDWDEVKRVLSPVGRPLI
jgi:hypothetical protein